MTVGELPEYKSRPPITQIIYAMNDGRIHLLSDEELEYGIEKLGEVWEVCRVLRVNDETLGFIKGKRDVLKKRRKGIKDGWKND